MRFSAVIPSARPNSGRTLALELERRWSFGTLLPIGKFAPFSSKEYPIPQVLSISLIESTGHNTGPTEELPRSKTIPMQSHRNTTRSQVAIPVSLALIFSALTGFGADISYSGNGVNDGWDNAGNWNGGTIPNDSTSGAAFNQEGTHVILDATTSGLCRGFMVGMYGKTNTATIEGGTLNCTWLDVGRSDQNGGNGTLTVSGGQITIANFLNIPTQFSTQVDPNNLGHGHLNLLGGTISVPTLHIGNPFLRA